MQQPPRQTIPELAHATTRPVHWLATAAALAAVVAASGFLQPDSATAAQVHAKAPAGKPAAVAPPDPADVRFPLDCGPVKAVVMKKAAGDLDGDGRPETVAVVRCDAGVGTPPSGIYVVTQPAGAEPRVVATLVAPKDNYSATTLAIQDGAVLAGLEGYSSDSVPRYRPDVHEKAKWQWRNGAFVRSTPSEARAA
ncbi:hypothetical protein ACYBSK_10625 [Streptomyces sp. BYX5S]